MGDFEDWRRRALGGRAHAVVYACGSEAYLRETIVAGERALAHPDDRTTIWATGHNDGAIWTDLNQHPLTTSRALPPEPGKRPRSTPAVRHVTVRDAHLMRNWKPLATWTRAMRGIIRVTFEAQGDDFAEPLAKNAKICPRGHRVTAPEDTEQDPRNPNRRHCAICRITRAFLTASPTRILAICSTPRTEAQRRDAALLVATQFGHSRAASERLLQAHGWSVGAAIRTAQKLELRDAPLTDQTIRDLSPDSMVTDYERALRRGDRAAASSAAHQLTDEQTRRLFARLDRWLGYATIAAPMARAGADSRAIARRTGASYGEANELQAQAGRLDRTSTDRAIMALARASADWRAGHRVGTMELLASTW